MNSLDSSVSPAIATHGLGKRYATHQALEHLDLAIPEGCLYGLLGPNGAGKTTTLDLLMNLIGPTTGEARILGHPCHELGPEQLRTIGYVSAEQELPRGRTVDQLCDYLAPLYPTWDSDLATRLCRQLELPRAQKLRRLSRGQRMKAALVLAMAFRPKVLILDEPFSGLDAMVREDLVSAILDPTQSEGWTVLISSHDLEGLEPLVDRIGILQSGRLVHDATVDRVAEAHRRIEVVFGDSPTILDPWPTRWYGAELAGRSLRFVDVEFESEEAIRRQIPTASTIEISEVGLRELFLAVCRPPRIAGVD